MAKLIKIRLLVTYQASGSAFGPLETKTCKVVMSDPPRLSLIEAAIKDHYKMPDRRVVHVTGVTQWPDAFFDTKIDEIDIAYKETPDKRPEL